MKKSNFTESQIVFILKQAEDGTAISEVCRKAGISLTRTDATRTAPSHGGCRCRARAEGPRRFAATAGT